MITWFMIEFKYFGEQYFANVFEYGNSPSQYQIHFINKYPHHARKIELKKTDGGIRLSEASPPIQEDLLEVIVHKIEEHFAN